MKKFVCLILALVMALSLVACGSNDTGNSGGDAGHTPTVMKIAAMGSDTCHVTQGFKKFEELLEAKCDWIDVQIFANGQLGTSADQCIGGMQNGIIQACDISVGNVAEYTNAFLPLDAPFMFTDRETAFKVVDGDAGKMMAEQYEKDTDVVLLGYFDYGFREVTNSKKAITSLADFAGLKIRTLNSNTYLSMLEGLGANPSTMAYSEVFTGLQQGTIDGQENPMSSIVDAKFYEVNNYICMTNHLYGFLGFHVSGSWFYGLDEETQQIVRDCATEAIAYQRDLCDEANTAALQTVKDAGCVVTEYDDATMDTFRDATNSVWTQISDKTGADYFNTVAKAAGF